MSRLSQFSRQAAVFCAAACLTQPLAAQTNAAKDYPNKPVRFISPFIPGAGTDTTARVIAQKLGDAWGQQFIVDNRTGAAGTIGVDLTAKAPPDGYTICLISGSHMVNSAVNDKLPYNLEKDLAAVTLASSLFYVLSVIPSVPAKSVKEFIAYAKANPGKLNFGSSGTGGLQHLSGELFNHLAGVKMTHVPYKGAAGVILAQLAGEVQVGFTTNFGVRPHAAAGKLRVLAMTAKKRSPALPDLPTMAESGVPGYEVDQSYGIVTGAKVPPAIVKKLQLGVAEALKAPDVVKQLSADGATMVGSTPEEFSVYLKGEIGKWRKLVKTANLKLEQ